MIIKRPIITEKSMRLAKDGLYTFEVLESATKGQISKIVANRFNVGVDSVKTILVKGEIKQQRKSRKNYKTAGYKKALVKVNKGDKIALFETPKDEVVVTTAEGEPRLMKEKKDFLGRTKIKVEKSAVGASPTTQRKVITGK